MKKLLVILLALAIAFSATPSFAQRTVKGASAQAQAVASDEAVFHRVGDWFATRGKSPEERQAILAERKAKRAAARAEKEARKAQKQAQKAMKQQKAKMQDLQKTMKK